MTDRERKIVPVSWTDVDKLKKDGFTFSAGDIEKANSDGFVLMKKEDNGKREIVILCPTFLRGPIHINGCLLSSSFSY